MAGVAAVGTHDGSQIQVETSCHLCRAWGYLARDAGRAKVMCCLFGCCEPLRDFRKVLSMSRCRPHVWKSHWRRLGVVRQLSVAGFQELSRADQLVLSRSMESTDLGPASGVGGARNKGTVAPASTSVSRESCLDPYSSSPHAEASQLSSSSCVCGAF